MTRCLAIFAAALALALSLALPAEAHSRCDHADHNHRRYSLTRTWVEHWRYQYSISVRLPWTDQIDVWSVDGTLVRIAAGSCGR